MKIRIAWCLSKKIYIYSNLDIVYFALKWTRPSSHFEDLLCIFHLIWWIIRYIEQKGSDRLVHCIKVWADVYKWVTRYVKLHYYAGKAALGSKYIFHYHNSIFVLLHMYSYLVWCFSGGEVTNVWNIFCLSSKLLSLLPLLDTEEVVAGSSDPLEVEDNPSAKEKFLYTFSVTSSWKKFDNSSPIQYLN